MADLEGVLTDEWQQLAHVLDAAIDDLSAEQQAVAIDRAARRASVAELDPRDDGHLRLLWDELRVVALRASLDRLVAKRELEVRGVAASGHLIYKAPPGGKAPRRPV